MGLITKADLYALIDDLWISPAHRDGLKYKIKTKRFTSADIEKWGDRFERAIEKQQELVVLHGKAAADDPEVKNLDMNYTGVELKKKRRIAAGRILRATIKERAGLTIPADLSRSAVERYL